MDIEQTIIQFKSEASAGAGSTHLNGTYQDEITSIVKLFNLKRRLPYYGIKNAISIVKRSHEKPIKTFYLVFKPFNKLYDKSFNAIDHVRKRIGLNHKYESLIITREINATKVHYNVLVFTKDDMMDLHDRQTNKYKIYCQEVNADALRYTASGIDVSGKHTYREQVEAVYDYIFKESHVRKFIWKLDYFVHDMYGKINYPKK